MACYEPIIYGPSVDVLPVNKTLNAEIPFTGKPSLTMRPVYADDNVTVAYYSYELKFETVIYLPVSQLVDIDAEVRRLRNILSTPGQKLKLSPTGLGTFPIINGTVVAANSTPDLTGGPRLQEISVEPFATNNAIAVSGIISFDISHCSPYINRDLVQFNSELDMQIDENGNISFKVFSTYQSRNPITNKTAINNLVKHIRKDAGKIFQGMKKRTRVSYSRDQRTAHIEVTFTDPGSDSAFAPLTKHIEFTDSMESQLLDGEGMSAGGFYKWIRQFTGTITLPPRVNKIWAWYVFRQILIDRLRGVKLVNKEEAEIDTLSTTNQATDGDKSAWYVPIKIRFTNQVYTRTFEFDFQYLFVMDLESIMAEKANLFSNARHNLSVDNLGRFVFGDPDAAGYKQPKLSDEWFVWEEYDNYDLNGFFKMESTGPVVVAQCAGTPNPPPPYDSRLRVFANQDTTNDLEKEPSTGENASSPGVREAYRKVLGSNADARLSWLAYDNKISIIQKNENEHISFLQEVPKEYYQASTAGPAASSQGFSIDHNVTNIDSAFEAPNTVTFGPSTYKVRMKGSALRVGYTIPTPAIVSVKGSPVTRSGESRYAHQMIAQSNILNEIGVASSQTSVKFPVYLAMWDIEYNVEAGVKGVDILQSILTSGSPGHYA